jgi:hypothetical protein
MRFLPSHSEELWNRQDTILLSIGIALSLLAKGIALFALAYSVDDLVHSSYERFSYSSLSEHAFREGRFLAPFIVGLIDVLGVDLPRSFTLFGFWLMVCFSLCGILLARLWRLQHSLTMSAIVVAVVVLHPYQADFFTWKIALNVGLPFAVGLAAVLIARDTKWGVLTGAGLFVIALGLYQVPLPFTACAVVMALTLDLARGTADDFSWPRWAKSASKMIGCLVLGTVVYVVIAKLIILSIGKVSVLGRDEIILLSHPTLVLARLRELLEMVTTRDPLTSVLQRIIFAALVGTTVFGIFFRAAPERAFKQAAISSAAFVVAIALCFVLATTLAVLVKAWIPVFRVLVGISVIWAGVVVSALVVTSGLIRKFVILATLLALFGFAGKNNEILTDQLRANVRDRLMMSRIVSDLERLPNFTANHRVVFVGTNAAPLRGLSTAADISHGWGPHGVTLSVFATFFGESGYLVRLLSDTTGYALGGATSEETDRARSICKTAPPWPVTGSIRSENDLAIVCLSAPVSPVEPHRLEGGNRS